jgi:DnaK suppressor protein
VAHAARAAFAEAQRLHRCRGGVGARRGRARFVKSERVMMTGTHADPIALQARQMLLRRRDTLRALLRDAAAPVRALRAEGAGEWAVTPGEGRLTPQLSSPEVRELEEVERALRRIEQGRFGTCEECGRAVGRQRLLAVPEARHCLGCSSAQAPRHALP